MAAPVAPSAVSATRRVPGRVDPLAATFLARLSAVGWPSISTRTPTEARRDVRLLAAVTSRVEPVARVRHATLCGPGGPLPVRFYTPLVGRRSGRPLLVWFHGGGFVVGDLFGADGVCRSLANRSGAVVVSVGYRLAPEHPFPAALDDAVAATRWAVGAARSLGADPQRVAIGGESGGATLAALVAQRARDENVSVGLQLLVYPATDLSLAVAAPRDQTGLLLTWETIDWSGAQYFGGTDPSDPVISPYWAADVSGLPPALIITAGHDLLEPDGHAYAERLRGVGVEVTEICYRGQIHGFFTMDLVFPAARRAQRRVGRAVASMPTHRQRGDTSTHAETWAPVAVEAVVGANELLERGPCFTGFALARTLVTHHLRRSWT